MKTLLAVLFGATFALSFGAKAADCDVIAKEAIEVNHAQSKMSVHLAKIVCLRWTDYAEFDLESWQEILAAELKIAKGDKDLEGVLLYIANATRQETK